MSGARPPAGLPGGDGLADAVAGRIAGTVRADIRALAAYPVADSAGCIKLDAMECPYALPEAVREDIARAASDAALNRYPPAGEPALRAAVRAAFGVPDGAGLLFGNGSDELIHLIVQACCQPGDAVLSPWPSFVYFDMAARFDHARFVGVPLAEDLSLDLPAMLAAIREHRPKVVFLAVPNNPTGGLWADEDIAAIVREAPGLVVLDEAYQPFAGRTWMGRVLDAPNTVVMRTVSKIGLAGLRFGYLAGHPAWIAELDKVRPPYNVDVLAQAALLAVLRHKPALDEQAARMRADREPLAAALAALPGVRVFPSAGNFVLARFSGKMDGNAVHLALKARKILVRNFSRAHPLLAGCLRISVGAPAENAALLSALQDILSA